MPKRSSTHKTTKKKHPSEEGRLSAHARGYDANWRRLRRMVLNERPLCEDCSARGRAEEATEVDHIDGNVRNLDGTNLKSLCKSCHSKKTVANDGGLGRSSL